MRLVARDGPNGAGKGANFFNGTTLNIVTRSRYGKRAVANMTREIRPAKSLRVVNSENSEFSIVVTCSSLLKNIVDPAVKAGYDHTISTAVQEITLFEEERKELVEKLNSVKQEDQVFEERLVSGAFVPLCTAV